MSRIGTTELMLILALALIIFGPSKLPQLGQAVGETIKSFRKGASIENNATEEKNKTEM